ncbi:glycosyltransferase WbuB [Roseateles aquatilis]|uniref:Glycosyltransferase WbuB n=1 Tax=Roseateles aquatilis TaxID=431061 RepID=A0A246JLJ3_9BURK|nr:glycosyltransferase family 4 protein [Roseateles aquatilis]OWQ93069.1 glycosyltransferase WbuB [Roseateles aquatilis]
MKILYHHRTASKDGQAVHIEEMIGSLRALGHEVHVVAPGGESAPEDKARMGDDAGWVHRLRARLPKWVYELLELAYSLVAYRRLAAAAKVFQPDLIYERYNLYLLSGLMLKKRLGLPLLLEVNAPLADERDKFGGLALPRLARWAEGVVWRGADAVLPVTKVLGAMVAARGVPPQRLVVIPNGINEEHFDAAPSPEDAKQALGWDGALVLGFTGFVRDWHGMDRVIRWMATDAAPGNARLLVVGDGPAREDLERLALALRLGERVRFTGVISRDEVPRHVAAFDIALQPAVVAYASPLKLFEYLALGKAIVAPRQPNIEEVLDDDVNALLFDPAEAGALETLLARLASDAALRRRLGEGAHATIGRLHLTWLGNAQRVVALGQSLRAGGAEAGPGPATPATQVMSPTGPMNATNPTNADGAKDVKA